MANRLTDIHVEKIDLVGSPAIRRTITLFKSQDGDRSVKTDELIAAIEKLDEKGKVALQKALGEPADPIKALKELGDEERKVLAEALGIAEPEPEDKFTARVLKALGLSRPPEDVKLPEAVQKAVTAMETRLAKAEEETAAAKKDADEAKTKLAKAEAERRRERFIQKAQQFQSLPGVTADDFAVILEKIDTAVGAEEFQKVEQVFRAAQEQVRQADIYREIGTGGAGTGGDVYAEVQQKAVELRKADATLTIEQARARVWNEEPELFRRYNEEHRQRLRDQGE